MRAKTRSHNRLVIMRVWRWRAINMSAADLLLTGEPTVALGTKVAGEVWLDGRAVEFTAMIRFVGETRLGHGHGAAIVGMSDLHRALWLRAYEAHVERAVAQVPPSIGRYLLRRATTRTR